MQPGTRSMTQKPRRNLRVVLLPPAAALVRHAPLPLLRAGRPVLARLLSATPGWRPQLQASMRAALGPDGFERRHVDAYFGHLANLLISCAAIYQKGIRGSGVARAWEAEPGSREVYQRAHAAGKGALLVCPHVIGHEIGAGVVSLELPITVLARKSPEPEYEALKQRWYEALGVQVVYRPGKGTTMEALQEVTTALRVLRKNHVLAITPDLVQAPGTGVPVMLFGRTVELPAGAFFLAVRTGAPLLPSFFYAADGGYRMRVLPPVAIDPALEREDAVAAAARAWTAHLETFVREHPDMWQQWLDKKWRKWLGV